MAITRVNSASIASVGGTTSATVTIPVGTGILAGDLLIVCAGSQVGHTTNGISVQDAVNATPYTTILETDLGGSSTRWQQTFAFTTPANIPDGTVLTCTGFATATNTEFSVDIFRGVTATISRAAVGSSNGSGASSAAPALATAPPANDLVLTFCMAGSGTLTPAAPFTKGSSGTSGASTAVGYVLAADGVSTYGSTWTLGTTNTSAAQTVSFAASSGTTINGTASLVGAGSLSDVPSIQLAPASLAGAGALVDVSSILRAPSSLTGAGQLTPPGSIMTAGASLAGAGALTNVASILRAGASLTGAGLLIASTSGTVTGTATLVGAGSLTAAATLRAGASLVGVGTMSPVMSILRAGASLSGAGSLTAAQAGSIHVTVWNGSAEISVASVHVWNGASEIPATFASVV